MIRDALLSLGLLLSTAAQLRFFSKFGPGELCLVIWIMLALYAQARRRGPPLTSALSRLLIFWLVFAFAQCLGLLTGLAIEEFRDTASIVNTTMAYLLVAILSCLIVLEPDTDRRLRRITWLFVAGGAASVFVLVAGGFGLVPIAGIDFWVFNRFLGWSVNPNNFALLCSVLVLLSLHLAETAAGRSEMFAALVCAAPSLVAGLLTKSDSFILLMLIAGPMFLAVKLWTWSFSVGHKPSIRMTFACLMFISVPVLLASAPPFGSSIADQAQKFATATMEQNNQAENRLNLWREAIDVGIESGLLGLGPGPHLVSKRWKRPPPDKSEAHNTIFDLLTQGGILAVLSFVWLIAMTSLVTYRARLIGLTTLVFALLVFSMFHLIIRHPIFWFSIALCLALADGVRMTNTDRNRRNVRFCRYHRHPTWPKRAPILTRGTSGGGTTARLAR